MKLVVTGGGTGGHVYPALEVALEATRLGWQVQYLGSLRGQEGRACQKEGVPFVGFPAEPLVKPVSWRGMKATLNFLRASINAQQVLRRIKPHVVFSTGGYSAAPVVSAARKLHVPYVLHEQNSIPGRTNLLLAPDAKHICTVFHASEKHFSQSVIRTGMPLRKELRDSAQGRLGIAQSTGSLSPLLLIMGGSQGAAALNDVGLATALRMANTDVQWLHLTGPKLYEATLESKRKLGVGVPYEVRAFLEADEMASALFSCWLSVSRSGAGTLCELAAFRKPAILVPYPHSFGQHQLYNAKEFENINAAALLEQNNLSPSNLEARIRMWLYDQDLRRLAETSLCNWDMPDATQRIITLLKDSAAIAVGTIA